MRSQKGFAAVYLLCFVPLLLALLFAVYMYFTYSDSHLELTQSCLVEQIETQEKVKRSLKTLLSLNPKAIRLKAQYETAVLHMRAAAASGNTAAFTAAQLRVSYIWNQRMLLDLQQKSIINSANFYLQSQQSQLFLKLQREALARKNKFGFFAQTDVKDLKFKPVKLAVVPASKDIAPVYQLSENFIEDQALEVTWILKLKARPPVSLFLPVETSSPQSCSTTINNKEDSWPTVTREVKSLSKPLS
jgi:hypothetical protein